MVIMQKKYILGYSDDQNIYLINISSLFRVSDLHLLKTLKFLVIRDIKLSLAMLMG